MYPVTKLAKHLELNALGVFGTDIFVGRFDDTVPNRILITNEAGGSSPVTINGRSLFENDLITVRIMGNDSYTESINYVNKFYNWFRDNKHIKTIAIIDLTANQPVLIERTKDNIYKFAMTVEVLYNQTEL